MKNYYKILDIPENATDEQIRKAYRHLALKYHPDRNPGDPSAEERFKEIAEAYGVLIDPAKHARFEQWLSTGTYEQTADNGFHFTQEEIFKDLFKDPRFTHIFQDLFREFNKAGFRFDERFFNQIFFGGKGVLFGGVFVWSPFGSRRKNNNQTGQPPQVKQASSLQINPFSYLKLLVDKVRKNLLGTPQITAGNETKTAFNRHDLNYDLTVSADDARLGAWIRIVVDRGHGDEKLKIKIPPGTKSESRLRIKGKGRLHSRGSGDLFITVFLEKTL